MNTAKVSVLGGGDRLGLSEEDPVVYVHPSTVKYRVTQTAGQSNRAILDMSVLLIVFSAWGSNGNNGCFDAGDSDWLDVKSGEILYVEKENCGVTNRVYCRSTKMPRAMKTLIVLITLCS
jgi:hypothetical protein